MSKVLQGSIKAGESVTRRAERLLDAGMPMVELPQHVRELAHAARFPMGPGDVNLYQQAVKRWSGTIERLGQGAGLEAGEFTVRSATQRLVTELKGAKPDQIDSIVNRWVLERARHQARVVARHESVEAYRDASLDAMKEQDWVHGVRWTLSPAHPRPDICDVLANQDLYGLGPGGYPIDSVPDRHPSCLCSLVPIVDEQHFDRELAKAKGEPEPPRLWESGKKETGDQWLRAQSTAMQQAIAGPTRARLVAQGRSVMDGDSRFKPVHVLLGKPKPDIQRGPTVDASKLVKADRATMVRPFPKLPGQTVRPVPKSPSKRPSERPTTPVRATAPAVPPRLIPEYGKPAPQSARLLPRTTELVDRAKSQMPLINGLHEGTLPADFEPYVVNELRNGIEEALNLRHDRPINTVGAMLRSDRHYHDDFGGFMRRDEMMLAIRKRYSAQKLHDIMVHETIHTIGGSSVGAAYRGAGVYLEEIATEELAQAFVGGVTEVNHVGQVISMADVDAAVATVDMFPTATVKIPGAYQGYRGTFFSVVASATGETDARRLTDTVRNALRRWKLRAYATEQEAVEGMLDALEPSSANQREFYKRLFNDGSKWSP